MNERATKAARQWLPPVVLLATAVALFAYLLARFPYDGFYGQDAYAYYHQAEALWREITGQPQPEWSLFSTNGIYWPIGYHLHLLPGFLLGVPEAGRIVTLALASLAPVVVYLLAGEVWYSAPPGRRVVAGVVAGLALLLMGTYTRTGLSLMSDVPATFWGTLAVYCCVRAWSPGRQTVGTRKDTLWALVGGGALGIAITVRYSSALLIPALVAYLIAWRYTHGSGSQPSTGNLWMRQALWAALGLGIALLPQIVYLLTHTPGPALRAWSLENLLSSTVAGPDGSATYSQPMLVFYLLGPLVSSEGGFLSAFFLPALVFGAWILARQRDSSIMALVFAWWFIGVLAYSGTPYQAHRFALTFMPALVVLIGIGTSTAFYQLGTVFRRLQTQSVRVAGVALAAPLIVLGAGIGLVQGWRSVEQWAAVHASFNVQERQVVDIARAAARDSGQEGAPRVVSFGFSAPLYHYTGWAILDFFLYNESDIDRFLAAPGPRLLVLPEESIATQWAGTPSGARWRWIQENYELSRQGEAGAFTVYRIGDRR